LCYNYVGWNFDLAMFADPGMRLLGLEEAAIPSCLWVKQPSLPILAFAQFFHACGAGIDTVNNSRLISVRMLFCTFTIE
jgi:hypothetical protein